MRLFIIFSLLHRHQTKRAILRQGHIPQAFYFVLSGSGEYSSVDFRSEDSRVETRLALHCVLAVFVSPHSPSCQKCLLNQVHPRVRFCGYLFRQKVLYSAQKFEFGRKENPKRSFCIISDPTWTTGYSTAHN